HGGRPKNDSEACSVARASHGATGGADQPVSPSGFSSRTLAPYGGSASSSSARRATASLPSTEGGSLTDSRNAVAGRSTFPPFSSGGMPSWAVVDRVGLQARFNNISTGESTTGRNPGMRGIFENIESPNTSAQRRASSTRSSG